MTLFVIHFAAIPPWDTGRRSAQIGQKGPRCKNLRSERGKRSNLCFLASRLLENYDLAAKNVTPMVSAKRPDSDSREGKKGEESKEDRDVLRQLLMFAW
jgi:hypothetical protein